MKVLQTHPPLWVHLVSLGLLLVTLCVAAMSHKHSVRAKPASLLATVESPEQAIYLALYALPSFSK